MSDKEMQEYKDEAVQILDNIRDKMKENAIWLVQHWALGKDDDAQEYAEDIIEILKEDL